MQVYPIYHSGILVETKRCYYLFDYFKGELPPLNIEKPITVFCSHAHRDHFVPEIFPQLREKGMKTIAAVLAKDIPLKRYPQDIPVLTARAHERYTLSTGETVETLLSTDSGVAYLLTCEEGTVYHAGDLNDWCWQESTEAENRQMRGSYRHEIDMLRGRRIDLAFVPLDPRQRDFMAEGLVYFLKVVDCDAVYPMHFWGKHRTVEKFIRTHPEYAGRIRPW